MKKNSWMYSVIILTVISFLTIGYSAFTNNLNIADILAFYRAEADIRITNLGVENTLDDGVSRYEEYGMYTLFSDILLPQPTSTITYRVDVTNFGGVKMVLSQIKGLPDNLTYHIENYELDNLICDDSNKCVLGITKTMLITIKYKDSGYNFDNTNYNLKLEFVFNECEYKINYILEEANYEIIKDINYSDAQNDTITENNGVYTIDKKSKYSGLCISSEDLEVGETYILSYKIKKRSGTLENVGGYYNSSLEKSFFIDGKKSNSAYNQPQNNLSNDYLEHLIEFKFEYNEDDQANLVENKKIYIQINRSDDIPKPVVVDVYDIHLYNVHNEIVHRYDENSTIFEPPARENYKFVGWTTNQDGSGIKYEAGQNIVNLCKVNGCEINLFGQWKTFVGQDVYYIMSNSATADNIQSQYVENANGINFKKASGINNGKGLYVMADTMNDANPIYYYRGNVDDNNVVFGNFCWKILRTTDTGGIRLIYNGLKAEDGTCNNTGAATEAATGKTFNPTNIGIAGAGYNYTDKTSLKLTAKNDSTVIVGTIFANNVTYNNETGMYILSDDRYISTSNFTNEKEQNIQTHHFTCFKTVDEGCTSVYYIYMNRNAQIFYATLKNGRSLTDYLNIEFEGNSTNEISSTLHNAVDTWYAANMTNLTHLIEDSVYCNDRSLYNPWTLTSTISNDNDLKMHFSTKARIAYTGKPSVACKYKADSFTMSESIGNGKLAYPVGLITLDEAALAGMAWQVDSTDSFLNNDRLYWTMSPGFVSATGVYNGVIHSMSDTVAVNYVGSIGGGIRPVITLKKETKILAGFGTVENPFVIS